MAGDDKEPEGEPQEVHPPPGTTELADEATPSVSGNGGLTQAEMEAMGLPSSVDFVQMMTGILRAFAPHLQPEVAQKLIETSFSEQVVADQVTRDTVDNSIAIAEHPFLVVAIQGPDGGKGYLACPKPAHLREVKDALSLAQIVALLTTPLSRALLRAYGFKYEFQQVKRLPEQSLIHRV